MIKAFLEKNNYDRAATAKALGIDKSTLFRKIKNLDIQLPRMDGRFKSLFLTPFNIKGGIHPLGVGQNRYTPCFILWVALVY